MGVYVETKNSILSAAFGNTQTISLAPTCYLGLSTTTPSDDGTNFTEPSSDSGYERMQIGDYSDTELQYMTVADGTASNNQAIIFTEATGNWGTITYFGIFEAKTGGVPIITGALSTAIEVPANYTPLFRVGKFKVSIV